MRSVRGGLLNGVDHKDLHRRLRGLQLQAKLLFKRGHQQGGIRIDRWGRRKVRREAARRRLRHLVRHELDREIEIALESGSIDDDPFQMFHSSQMAGEGDNRTSFNSPEFDKVCEQARICVDPDKRNELWHKVDRILHDEQSYTFLMNALSTAFVDPRIHGIRRTPTGVNRNNYDFNPIPWWVPTGEQRYTK